MKSAQPQWRWEDGVVDERKEHIGLRYGDAAETPHDDWESIARIAKPKGHVFAVEWLIKDDSPAHQTMLADARRELDYYLVEKGEPNPWAYACYHCNTGANMYSRVHWSHFPEGCTGKRVSSMIVKLPPTAAVDERKRT